MTTISKALESEVRKGWFAVRRFVNEHHGSRPDLTAVLLLIGLNEVPVAPEQPSKEEIVDLIHVGTCTALGMGAHYVLRKTDAHLRPIMTLISPCLHLILCDHKRLI